MTKFRGQSRILASNTPPCRSKRPQGKSVPGSTYIMLSSGGRSHEGESSRTSGRVSIIAKGTERAFGHRPRSTLYPVYGTIYRGRRSGPDIQDNIHFWWKLYVYKPAGARRYQRGAPPCQTHSPKRRTKMRWGTTVAPHPLTDTHCQNVRRKMQRRIQAWQWRRWWLEVA